MSEALSALHAPVDAALGGVLLANMLEAWLDGDPMVLSTAETAEGARQQSDGIQYR